MSSFLAPIFSFPPFFAVRLPHPLLREIPSPFKGDEAREEPGSW
ncbi:hypothetical protein HMPREF9440_02191 [Sutterella parvirubra YIT 11816]|uniref:Uncharacterized protein n=1 Tax=Sutterella parvirubra YIT 11816 TaxID=762967 RepID=H3KHE8_9BURK|nr:hypothetical protein HMPREF9440_02191 [Sutterella parvirubra YIT 11816]